MRCVIALVALLSVGCQSPCTRTAGREDGRDDGNECTLMARYPEHCPAFDPDDGAYGEGYYISFCNNADEACYEENADVLDFCEEFLSNDPN